jgi:hypothetical protein
VDGAEAPVSSPQVPTPPAQDTPSESSSLPADTLGVAFSGGGIRSATFCLGLLQAMARGGWLRWVDFLSTVSGGGYIGAFLGRFFDLCNRPGGLSGGFPDQSPGAAQERVARELSDSRSPAVSWLRQHANYLTPTGLGDALPNVAGFGRNLLSIYLVLALFFFAVFGTLHAIGYSNPQGGLFALLGDLVATLTPLTRYLPMAWTGPWMELAELTFWFAVVPLMIAYWLVSQDLLETFIAPVLVVAAILAVTLLYATSSPLSIVVLTAAVFWALRAWAAVRRSEGDADPSNPARLMLAGTNLSQWLAFFVAVLVAFFGIGVVDKLGQGLARLMLAGGLTTGNILAWTSSVLMTLLALVGILRLAAGSLLSKPGASDVLMLSKPYLAMVLGLALGALPPLVAVSFASHVVYEIGAAYYRGLGCTVVAIVASLLLGTHACIQLVNRSSPLAIYAARLACAFLGAVNPLRRVHPEGRDVSHVVPGDDLPFDQYQPYAAGGPLHLINCAVNETIDVASQRGLRDRQAENMAVGPAGVNLAQRWHALWVAGTAELTPLAAGGDPHPFLDQEGEPVAVESLDLREWIAISGAAVGPGMGRATGIGRALLLTLANIRLGYWWNSGLTADDRPGVPIKGGIWQAFLRVLSSYFRAQGLLLAELVGRFGGPWYRYWYLSDGGNFELTGGYELLRRRVPFVIVCDAGRDEKQQGSDLGALIRLARVDLGAEVEEISTDPESLQQHGVPGEVVGQLGTLNDLLASGGDLPLAHAALFLVRYPTAPGSPAEDPWLGRRHTWLLYIKATITGDEPADVKNYAALHPDFPNETTLNQMFDEPQWESYRKLGEHIGSKLFVDSEDRSSPR